jgi:hypothetical protein
VPSVTRRVWRLAAAIGQAVIVFFASIGTAAAVGVSLVQPSNGATGVDPAVTIVAGIAASYPSVNTATVQLRDSAGNLIPVVIYAPGDESGNTRVRPISALDGGTTYTLIVKGGPNGIKDTAGNVMAADFSSSFTTSGAAPNPGTSNCPCTIWNPSSTAAGGPDNDASPVELGVRFRSEVSGFIRGVRFYKHASNTGAHIGNLWRNDGTLLATGTFNFESASGWQQLTFSTPVAVDANTTYVASYHTNTGHYAADAGFFASELYSPPLRALRDGADGMNGVYRYGASSAFPNETWQATNYWVDVVFTATATDPTIPMQVVSLTPPAGAVGVSVTATVTAGISGFIDYPSVNGSTFELHDPSGSLVPATVLGGGESQTFSLVPNSPLFPNARYVAIVKGGANGIKDRVGGHGMAADFSWSFATAASPTTPPTNCPCTIWTGASTTAAGPDSDSNPVELGVRFRSDSAGYIKGVRFYKHASNGGTHVGSLWTNSGTLLASATFFGESAAGWQQVIFSPPVAIDANATYVASYHTNTGHYATNNGYFAVGVESAPLHALRDGADGANGVYRYSSGPAFPNQSYLSSNYWVDVLFDVTTGPDIYPPTITFNQPPVNATDVATNVIVTATFNELMNPATITTSSVELRDATGALVPATVNYSTGTGSAILTPLAPLAMATRYTATVRGGTIDPRVKDTSGNALAATYSWSFTTAAPPPPPAACPCSIWNDSTIPAVIDTDSNPVELGVRFRSDSSGYITAIRFYKGLTNTGVHIGNLWTDSGTLLARATFQSESSGGWQQVALSPPVAIAANTPYVVSYHTNVGNYAANNLYFNAGFDNAPLHAYRSGVGGPNGLYKYGSSTAFPTDTYNATNYWVDVVFSSTLPADATPPGVNTVTPAAGSTGVNVGTVVTATFTEMMRPSSFDSSTFELRGPSGILVPATILVGGETPTVTVMPSSPLLPSTQYTATVKAGVKDLAGNAMVSNFSWIFVTAP